MAMLYPLSQMSTRDASGLNDFPLGNLLINKQGGLLLKLFWLQGYSSCQKSLFHLIMLFFSIPDIAELSICLNENLLLGLLTFKIFLPIDGVHYLLNLSSVPQLFFSLLSKLFSSHYIL